MGLFTEAGMLWIVFLVLTLYLECSKNDNNHVTAWRKFSIFALKTCFIAVVVMGLNFILTLLGANNIGRAPGRG